MSLNKSKVKAEIHALHGFLGLPTDWNVFKFPHVHQYDLQDPLTAPAEDGFWGWAKRFNHLMQQYRPDKRFFLGYSLGARLGLHALLENPSNWAGGIFVSAHPGFQKDEEKAARLKADHNWAQSFLTKPWPSLLKEWNAQAPFAGIDFPIPRDESCFSRKNLADQLRLFSRGKQEDLSHAIQKIPFPLLWICGELDAYFCEAAKKLNFLHPLSKIVIVEGAAHRVPWEKPEKFKELTYSFIQEVLECR